MNLNKIKQLREDAANKAYEGLVTNLCVINDEWLLGYSLEQTVMKVQKVLDISHLTKKKFEVDEVFSKIPEILIVFPESKVVFYKEYPRRGYTACCVLVNTEK